MMSNDKPMPAIIKEQEFIISRRKPLYDYMVHCPVCDEFIGYATEYQAKERFNYCHRCGQRIEVDLIERWK